jgi:alkylhydroperoxidase family enzyme
MSWIAQIDEDAATGQIARLYETSRQRAGSVANIIKVMSRDARTTEQSMVFYVTLMKSPNALDAARREMLAAVVSNVNDCYY